MINVSHYRVTYLLKFQKVLNISVREREFDNVHSGVEYRNDQDLTELRNPLEELPVSFSPRVLQKELRDQTNVTF